MQQCRQLPILQIRKSRHSPLPGVNGLCNLVLRHLVFDSNKRRKCRQDSLALIAVTDRAMPRVRFRTRVFGSIGPNRRSRFPIRRRTLLSRVNRFLH